MKSKKSRFIAWLLIFGMIFAQNFLFNAGNEAYASETAKLIITGTGLNKDLNISSSDCSNYNLIERTYSANNSFNFHKIIKVKGFDLFDLIGNDNLKSDKDYDVKFTCSDGFEFSKKVSELKNVYYYSNFTDSSKTKISPMIAKYSAVLADYPKDSFRPPVSWADKVISESNLDKDFPKLIFGQTSIDDMNMSRWGKQIVKITVGDDRELSNEINADSSYKHISYDSAPYNTDAITGATFTIEGPGVKGYRAVSLRQIEEDTAGLEKNVYYENIDGKTVQNTYEGINAKYLIDNYVDLNNNAGNIIFKNKSRQTILKCPIEEAGKYSIAYGVNEVPLVFLDSDVGYREQKFNDNGCFKLVYAQNKGNIKEFSNVAYIYVEEKNAKNVYEHYYAPYNDKKYTDYELIIHGSGIKKEVKYKVSDIEAMKSLQVTKEYSLSNSEYFWYYNSYKGVPLWNLLLRSGMDPNIDENTKIRFIAADNYNFAPMTIKEIKESSMYGYYEKNSLDKGDGSFDGKGEKPLYSGLPVLVTYGFNGYPYVIRATDEGFNPGLGNEGGPLRIILGKTSYSDTNGSNQVQFAKEIIVGEGESLSVSGPVTGGITTGQEASENSSFKHNEGIYENYLDTPILRITGSQVKEPVTLTLRQIESLTKYSVKDIYTGDGIREFEGVVLWDLITQVAGLKEGVDVPSIRVFSGPNYNQILRSTDQVVNGVLNSHGKNKKIILAYGVDGYPLVPNEGSGGYINNNAYGPLRLIIEESKSMWVKWTDCIVVGTGEYEQPKMDDVKETNIPDVSQIEKESYKTWLVYKNNTGKELLEASVRSIEFDKDNNLWIGTNNGGLSKRSPKGVWIHYKEIETENIGKVIVDTCYAIAQRENGELWVALGSPETAKGILIKKDGKWNLINKNNSSIPSNFVQELELDKQGGLWIGTGNGAVHIDKDNNWNIYDKTKGLLLSSIDAIEVDDNGGVWIGFFVETSGEGENIIYKGAYQHIDKDGKITSYTDFENKSYGGNWIRSISEDENGGVWITRSGNYLGQGQAEIDYVINGIRTVYKAKDLVPDITDDDDIRFVLSDKQGLIYIATQKSGVLISSKVGNLIEKYNSSNMFPTNQWNNVYFIDFDQNNLLIGTNGGAAVYKESIAFKDIKNSWAKKEIENMAAMGYIEGYNGMFKPSDNITRAEFTVLITRVLGIDLNDSVSTFKDVKSNDWYLKYIQAAYNEGLIKGYEDGTFKPNAPITRQEVASTIGSLLNSNLSENDADEILSHFSDKIDDYGKISVAKSIKAEIIKGIPNNLFAGSKYASKAEVAVMMLRILKN